MLHTSASDPPKLITRSILCLIRFHGKEIQGFFFKLVDVLMSFYHQLQDHEVLEDVPAVYVLIKYPECLRYDLCINTQILHHCDAKVSVSSIILVWWAPFWILTFEMFKNKFKLITL